MYLYIIRNKKEKGNCYNPKFLFLIRASITLLPGAHNYKFVILSVQNVIRVLGIPNVSLNFQRTILQLIQLLWFYSLLSIDKKQDITGYSWYEEFPCADWVSYHQSNLMHLSLFSDTLVKDMWSYIKKTLNHKHLITKFLAWINVRN
jgi:hypothetical protein